MGPGGRHPSRPLAAGHVAPKSGPALSGQLPTLCPAASRTHVRGPLGAMRLSGWASAVQWRLLARVSWPWRSWRWVPIDSPSLWGKDRLWGGVTCGEWETHYSLQYSFLIIQQGQLSHIIRKQEFTP